MNHDEAVTKVRKLLSLANSANENEAALAAARAAEIMERYRLDAAMVAEAEQREIEAEEPFAMNVDKAGERGHARTPTWYWALAWGCAKANRCKPHHTYRAGKYAVAFVGRPSDAGAARYMLDAIANEVDRLAVVFVSKLDAGARSAGRSFRLGAAHTIGERLKASTQETTEKVRGELAAAGDEQGLARLENALVRRTQSGRELDAFATANGVRYGAARGVSVSNAGAYAAGRTAGASVGLRGGTTSLGSGARALGAGSR